MQTKTFDSLPAQTYGEERKRLLEIKRWYAKYGRQVSFLCSLALFLLFVPGLCLNEIV